MGLIGFKGASGSGIVKNKLYDTTDLGLPEFLIGEILRSNVDEFIGFNSDGNIIVWDTVLDDLLEISPTTGSTISSYPIGSGYDASIVSPDGTKVACIYNNNTVRLLDANNLSTSYDTISASAFTLNSFYGQIEMTDTDIFLFGADSGFDVHMISVDASTPSSMVVGWNVELSSPASSNDFGLHNIEIVGSYLYWSYEDQSDGDEFVKRALLSDGSSISTITTDTTPIQIRSIKDRTKIMIDNVLYDSSGSVLLTYASTVTCDLIDDENEYFFHEASPNKLQRYSLTSITVDKSGDNDFAIDYEFTKYKAGYKDGIIYTKNPSDSLRLFYDKIILT